MKIYNRQCLIVCVLCAETHPNVFNIIRIGFEWLPALRKLLDILNTLVQLLLAADIDLIVTAIAPHRPLGGVQADAVRVGMRRIEVLQRMLVLVAAARLIAAF